jgi:uncharacterized protein
MGSASAKTTKALYTIETYCLMGGECARVTVGEECCWMLHWLGLFGVLLRRGFWWSVGVFRYRAFGAGERVEGEYYVREGLCNGCGQCCQQLYLTYKRSVIDCVQTFEAVKALHPAEYGSFYVVDETETGLVFGCERLLADNRCGDYARRPSFCRSYPTEDSLLQGGKLPVECGYWFKLKRSFGEVLGEVGGA